MDFKLIYFNSEKTFDRRLVRFSGGKLHVGTVNQYPYLLCFVLYLEKAYQLPFELLADQGGKVSKLYDARIPFLRMTKHIIYLLDAEHRVAAAYENMLGGEKHIQEMVAASGK